MLVAIVEVCYRVGEEAFFLKASDWVGGVVGNGCVEVSHEDDFVGGGL